jgi:type II secretory pathway component PulK
MFRKSNLLILKNESGVALLFAVFVLTIATIIVVELTATSSSESRSLRSFTEGIQADYILQSAVNFGQIIIELPKLEGQTEDWLGDPWATIGLYPALPVEGLAGDVRVAIIDEDSKIDLNNILDRQPLAINEGEEDNDELEKNPFSAGGGGQNSQTLFWQNSLLDLFTILGFQTEKFKSEERMTRGDIAYGPATQVAAIQDWLDLDTSSYKSPAFEGKGVESSLPKNFFYNRNLYSLAELPMIPGITIERARRIAPFLKATSSGTAIGGSRVNINTAPYEVLIALGFSNDRASEIIEERTGAPLNQAIVSKILEADPSVSQYVKVSSGEFSIIAQVKLPSVTKWLKATVKAQTGGAGIRKTDITSTEHY